ncbi:DUF2515 domain-containing protein [Neobacillus cucumis]|uniref:DUF2515 domain-containing protein n=1 Tax=Neobacillus cucumis TaxID=1740721 RepID=UPI002E1E96EB|nr:DUF2515 domain-containing protein [Neobacillus cucumis]
MIKEELKNKSNSTPAPFSVTKSEQILVEKIMLKTKENNLNNVTRTRAYLDFYLRYPDIHWAFLGHMVSRNGGWNMTDLKGELLTRLMTKKDRVVFFQFLERGNWLIFQDVYPQFLLYEESLRQGKPLFHLFRHFNISIFMEILWHQFWKSNDAYILTIALVINEQYYLEKRMVQNPQNQKDVLNKLEFLLQDWLSFNHILFPYGNKNLVGQTLHQFESLHERILLGKRLYKILFHQDIHPKVVEWAKNHHHTGSRKDYWPDIFNSVNEGTPGFPYQLHLESCQLRPSAKRIYSPTLENAWENVKHIEAEIGDWFNDWHVVDYLKEDEKIVNGEIKDEYCKTLERLELAALAKKAITF